MIILKKKLYNGVHILLIKKAEKLVLFAELYGFQCIYENICFTNNTDRHDIVEILLKVASSTMTLTLITIFSGFHHQ